MDRLYIIKIGGNIIDDDEKLGVFLSSFAALDGKKILVHGGGKLATKMAAQLNIEQTMVEGRRITDAQTLKVVTMVYAGLINKNIVAQLQAKGCNATGLCGADGNSIHAHKRGTGDIDYGFVGDVDGINPGFIQSLLAQDICPVFAPITHDQKGQLLNTNADTIAQELAKGMSSLFETTLIFSFEKEGVLLDIKDDNSAITSLNPAYYSELKEGGKIVAGMIPKIDNAFSALDAGVKQVIIGNAMKLSELTTGQAGTRISYE